MHRSSHICNPLNSGRKIGRRTGKLIQKKRNQNNGVERFDDYLSESDEEKSLNVTDLSVVSRKRETVTDFDSVKAKAMSNRLGDGTRGVAKPKTLETLKSDKHAGLVTRNSKFGRRTGKIIQKKRNLHNDVENFDDYLTESDVEKSLNVAESTTLSGRCAERDASLIKENSNVKPQNTHEISKACQPGVSLQTSQQVQVGRLPARNGRFGRRTGKDLLAGKENKNLENFSAYFTDSSDLSLSLNPTPKSVQTEMNQQPSPELGKQYKSSTTDVPAPKNSTVLDQQMFDEYRETGKCFDMEDPLGPAASPIKRVSRRFSSSVPHKGKVLFSDAEELDKEEKEASRASRRISLSRNSGLIVEVISSPVQNTERDNSVVEEREDKVECSVTDNARLPGEDPATKEIRDKSVAEPSITQQNISKLGHTEGLSDAINQNCQVSHKLAPSYSETMAMDENGSQFKGETLKKTKKLYSNNRTSADQGSFVRISTSMDKVSSQSKDKGNISKKADATILKTRKSDGPSNIFSAYGEQKSVFLSLSSHTKVSACVDSKSQLEPSPFEMQNKSAVKGESSFKKHNKSTSKRKKMRGDSSLQVEENGEKSQHAEADSHRYEKDMSQQEKLLQNTSKQSDNVISEQSANELDQELLKVAVQTEVQSSNTKLKAISFSRSTHKTISQSSQLLETPKTGDRRKFKNAKKNIFASPIPEVVSPPKKARHEYDIEPLHDAHFPDKKHKVKSKPRELVKTSKSKSRRGRGRPPMKQKVTKGGKKSNKTDEAKLGTNLASELEIVREQVEPSHEDVISLPDNGSQVSEPQHHQSDNDKRNGYIENVNHNKDDISFTSSRVTREDHVENVDNISRGVTRAASGSRGTEPATKKYSAEKIGSSKKSVDQAKVKHSDDLIVTYAEPLKSFSGRSQYRRSRSIAGKSKRSISFTTPGKEVSSDNGETDSPVALRLIDTLPNVTPRSGVSFRRSNSFVVALDNSPASPDPYKFELERHRVHLADTTPRGTVLNRPTVLTSCLRDSSVNRPPKPSRKVRISNIVDTRAIDALETSMTQSGSLSTVLPSPSAPPVHYADITTANTSQTSLLLPDLTHLIVRPKSSETSAGLRRSKRTRVKPVAGYKGESVIYRRDSSGHGLVVDGIQPSVGEAKLLAVEEKRRTNLRKRRLKSMTVPSERPKRRLSTHAVDVPENTRDDDRIIVTNPDTEEEVLIDNVSRRNKVQWLGPDLAPVLSSDPTAVCAQLQQPSFSSGELQLRALADKPYERATQTLVFIVLHGKLCLKINNQIFIVETSDHFFVPRNSAYSIQNLRREVAKLSFVNLHDSS